MVRFKRRAITAIMENDSGKVGAATKEGEMEVEGVPIS